MGDPDLILTSCRRNADVYRFRASDGFGWAICTVNDSTGELLVCSDWGNWVHRWDVGAMGRTGAGALKTLTAFIAGFKYKLDDDTEDGGKWRRYACDYLAQKLQGGKDREFSAEATTERLRERIIERRWEDAHRSPFHPRLRLSKEDARELWDELGELADDVGNGEQASALYSERLPADLHQYLSDIWESFAERPTAADRWLKRIILPALVRACAAENERRAWRPDIALDAPADPVCP